MWIRALVENDTVEVPECGAQVTLGKDDVSIKYSGVEIALPLTVLSKLADGKFLTLHVMTENNNATLNLGKASGSYDYFITVTPD